MYNFCNIAGSKSKKKKKHSHAFHDLELTPEGLLRPFEEYLSGGKMGHVITKRPDCEVQMRKNYPKKRSSKKGYYLVTAVQREETTNLI